MPTQSSLIQNQNTTDIFLDRGLQKLDALTTTLPLTYTFHFSCIKISCYSVETHLRLTWLAQPSKFLAQSLTVSNDGLFSIAAEHAMTPKNVWSRIIEPDVYQFFTIPVLGEYGTLKIEAVDANGTLLGALPQHSYYYLKVLKSFASDSVNPDGLVC